MQPMKSKTLLFRLRKAECNVGIETTKLIVPMANPARSRLRAAHTGIVDLHLFTKALQVIIREMQHLRRIMDAARYEP